MLKVKKGGLQIRTLVALSSITFCCALLVILFVILLLVQGKTQRAGIATLTLNVQNIHTLLC
jgi:hypothetical protein